MVLNQGYSKDLKNLPQPDILMNFQDNRHNLAGLQISLEVRNTTNMRRRTDHTNFSLRIMHKTIIVNKIAAD